MQTNIFQLLLNYGVPVLLVVFGGKLGEKHLNSTFWGSIIGLALAIIYISYYMRSELLMMRGSKALKKGDVKTAISYYDKALGKKLRVDYVIYAAYIYLRYGYEEKCFDAISRAKKSANLTSALKQELTITEGLYMWKTGKLEESEELFKSAHKMGESTQTYCHVGFILLEREKYDEAYDFNVLAMDYNPDDPSIKDNMALSHYHKGELDKALALYDEIMEKGTRFPVIYYNHAQCLYKAGDLARAKEQLECALHHNFSNLASVSKDDTEKLLEKINKEA